jgi:UTP:GlnB (protein PII) uridylyltransferase
MARHALSISSATALCWPAHGLALQRLVVTQTERDITGEPDWNAVGQDLRHCVASDAMPKFSATPVSDVSVQVDHAADGRATVVVHAEDGLGLLATVTGWLTAQGLTIDDAKAETKLGRVHDVFCVRSTDKTPAGVDAAALVALLSAR